MCSKKRSKPIYYTCPPPLLTAVVVSLSFGFLTIGIYLILGCENDWLAITGLSLDILGVLILAVPDVPRLSSKTIIEDLRTAVRKTSKRTLGGVSTDDTIYDALYETIDERLNLEGDATFDLVPTAPATDINVDVPLSYYSTSEKEFIVKDQSGQTTHLYQDYVIESLRNKIHTESGRFRRLGLYLIVIGFSVQAISSLFSSALILNWTAKVISRLGASIGGC